MTTTTEPVTNGVMSDIGYDEMIVVDGCTPRIGSDSFFEKIRAAGVTAVCVSLSAQVGAQQVGGFFDAVQEMNVYYNLAEIYPDRCVIATTSEDIRQAKADGKLAIVLAFQNGMPVEADPVNLVPFFYRNGVRIIQLTYNERNRLGDGCFEPENRGLTTMGQQVIKEMDRAGILIDLSHVGHRTGMDAIAYSARPAVFSHTGCLALTESPRNKSDEEIRLIAERGGLVGISPYAPFVEPASGERPTLDDFLDHVDHAVQLVGPGHVAIGTDIAEHWAVRWMSNSGRRFPDLVRKYTWDTVYADGFESLARFPEVAAGLAARGYASADIAKIVGGNWMRVFGEVWD
ncbi:membrane dipeptidase [Actinacidiphila alni]|uniref:Membrane dipeptidase n=1 Tax=Actinacidiphila alni TaxID=380248 RepID=A0A1I1XE57_9ACTN|nr:dipeptidase [Actinacidiphila alni]SFE05694.1 membrane dipeptidase [Actinacidiphila alni]